MQKIQFYLNRITFQSLVFISNILKKFETGRKINASLDSKFDFSYLFYRFFIEEDEINHWIGHSNADANFKISIVTPCFGMQALYLQELYQSLTIQDHTNWELCLCLDGIQPLDFENYVAKIVRQDKRVKTIRHETNLGISAATRSAVSIANGDAVLFADADDKLHKRALKRILKKIGQKLKKSHLIIHLVLMLMALTKSNINLDHLNQ